MFLSEPSETNPRVIDVSEVHPLHPTSSLAEVTPGTAAAQREQAKHSSDAARTCAQHHWRLTAAAVETTGAWGPEAKKLVRELARKQAMRLGENLWLPKGWPECCLGASVRTVLEGLEGPLV